MKVMTIVGTRPELIRLSAIIPKLDKYGDHILVHTGQNYDPNLKDIFFKNLNIRTPNYSENCKGDTPFEIISQILTTTENIITTEDPDKLLILGDTNSGLSSIVAKRYGVKVYHMEAGNRCFNDIVPEEINRRIIDHSSDILLPYTQNSKQNLIAEGIPLHRIFVTGNPISEIIINSRINDSITLKKYNVLKDNYILATLHRSENVSNIKILTSLINSLINVYRTYNMPVIVSLHPTTKFMLKLYNISCEHLTFVDPMPFTDFVAMETNAFCVISDSGTVQEECNLVETPNVTIRTTTERPETIECGSNIISGYESENILNGVKIATDMQFNWADIPDYMHTNVSDTVVKILLGVYP